ncbi:MAG: sugar phosphate isomerase/epimerase [Candidatus Sumerlaeota bacterium]|nr:sugar phosphate isomerase/epimerase [Candidatus Sumerlaeota bacterium]
MAANKIVYSVFTKPWKAPIPELGRFVHGLGFDGIELPVRPGFQVEPESIARDLPVAVRQLADCGVKILSVAGPTDEATIAACGETGVPVLRTLAAVKKGQTYLEAEAECMREWEALIPLLEKHGVTIGVQNHADRFVPNACGLRRVLEKFDPKHVAAVWDPAHCALNGELPDLALDILWDRLCMVNLKNGIWVQTTPPGADEVRWKKHWTTGRKGLAPWRTVVEELKKRNYEGVVCLTAEYSDHDAVDRQIVEDLAFAKSLFEG